MPLKHADLPAAVRSALASGEWKAFHLGGDRYVLRRAGRGLQSCACLCVRFGGARYAVPRAFIAERCPEALPRGLDDLIMHAIASGPTKLSALFRR